MNGMLDNQIVKSGYLVKSARGTLTGWKKRYFVMNGSTITYFADHNNLSKAKGDLLLTQDSGVEEMALSGKAFCVRVTTPFSVLVVATKDEDERLAWKTVIDNAIRRCKTSLRSYITKKGGLIEGKTRRFFILDEGVITYHKDHEHTGQILGVFKVSKTTKMSYKDSNCSIDLIQGTADDSSVMELRFLQATEEYDLWKSVLLTLAAEPSGADAGPADEAEVAEEAPQVVLKKGKLKMRPAKGGELWDDFNFTLTPTAMIALDEITGTQVIETFHINPTCSVFETNLGRNAFELVTPKRVLHVMAESREVTSSWIKVLREAISQSTLEPNDPLLAAAIEKMKSDVIYSTSFHEDKPLGVVLERSGEWAIVKLANERETGVKVGSALMSVNSDDVMFARYQETIGRLKNWRPPLTLTFLKSPEKRGFLVKESRGRHSSSRNWKKRFFVIEQGRIYYKDKDDSSCEIKGDIPLMGSAVSLASSQETGKFFCFRLVSGVTCLIMQAETFDDLIDWAATLYHAIGIANGGAHILRVEYEKRTKSETAHARTSSDISLSEEAVAAVEQANAKADLAVSDMIAKERAKLHGGGGEEPVMAVAVMAEELPAPPVEEAAVEVVEAVVEEAVEDVAEEAVAPPEAPEEAVEAAAEPVPAAAEPVAEQVEVEEPVVDERLAAAEQALREATASASASASSSDLSSLVAALKAAEEAGVDVSVTAESSSVLQALTEQAVVHALNKGLVDAMSILSITALQTALRNAETRNMANDNSAAASMMLARLLEEEERAGAAETARLEAEAAALDAELAEEEASARAAEGREGAITPVIDNSDVDDEDLNVIFIYLFCALFW
jgi:hypothetical protein